MPKPSECHPTLLANRNFILLWCAYGVSAMGDHLSEMAILKTLGVLDTEVDVTPLDARMSFVFFLPFLFLAPVAGLLADRLPRRGLMVVADLVRCVIMFFFAYLIALATPTGSWGPFLPLLLVGIFAAAFSPARSALLPTLIQPGQLVRANGLISGLGIIATMTATLLGGYLAKYYEPVIAFRWDALTFLVSAGCLMFIRIPDDSAASRDRNTSSFLSDIAGGIRYVRDHRHVRELLIVAVVVWFCGPLVKCVIPAIVRDVYHGDLFQMSAYRAFLGVGFVLGATTIALLGNALRSEIAMTWGLVGIGGSIAVFATSVFVDLPPTTLYWIGAVGVTLAGMFAVTVMASFNALLQRTVADRFRGRVFGLKDLVTTAALLTATGLLGVPNWGRVDRWVGYILIGVVIVTLVAGFWTLRTRLCRTSLGPALTFLEHLNEFVAKAWWRLKVEGRRIPREGAVIVTANHVSYPDPLLISAISPYRPIGFMIAAEYANLPVVSGITGRVGCIPVRRDGQDTSATKQSLRHLREGKALGIFIEGQIAEPGEPPTPKDGVAMLALKTGAPVIPVHISGTCYTDRLVRDLMRRHRAVLRVGPPVDLSDIAATLRGREAITAATARIYEAIHTLAPPRDDTQTTRLDQPGTDSRTE